MSHTELRYSLHATIISGATCDHAETVATSAKLFESSSEYVGKHDCETITHIRATTIKMENAAIRMNRAVSAPPVSIGPSRRDTRYRP